MADTVNNVWSSLANLLTTGASAYANIAAAKAKLNQSRAAPAGTPTDTRSMNNQVPGNFSSKQYLDKYVFAPESWNDYLTLMGFKNILQATVRVRGIYND